MNQKKDGHNLIEKITFALGLAVVIALVSYLVFELTQKKNEPPQLVITTSHQPGEHYRYKVKIENMGEETAEAVNIQMSLYQEGKVVEIGTITINYVPVKSRETAWIVFHRKKKPNDSLVVSSVTYVKP